MPALAGALMTLALSSTLSSTLVGEAGKSTTSSSSSSVSVFISDPVSGSISGASAKFDGFSALAILGSQVRVRVARELALLVTLFLAVMGTDSG